MKSTSFHLHLYQTFYIVRVNHKVDRPWHLIIKYSLEIMNTLWGYGPNRHTETCKILFPLKHSTLKVRSTHGLELWLRLLILLTPFMKQCLWRFDGVAMLITLWVLHILSCNSCLISLSTVFWNYRFLKFFISMLVLQVLFESTILFENSVTEWTRQWLPQHDQTTIGPSREPFLKCNWRLSDQLFSLSIGCNDYWITGHLALSIQEFLQVAWIVDYIKIPDHSLYELVRTLYNRTGIFACQLLCHLISYKAWILKQTETPLRVRCPSTFDIEQRLYDKKGEITPGLD